MSPEDLASLRNFYPDEEIARMSELEQTQRLNAIRGLDEDEQDIWGLGDPKP